MHPTPPVTVVIGGSSGLGKVVARRYRDDGFRVAIVSRNKPAFVDQEAGFDHYSADLTVLTAEGARQLVDAIARGTGRPCAPAGSP